MISTLPHDDTIIALATPPGVAALAIIRLSGKDAISITGQLFKGKNLEVQPSHTVHLGTLEEDGVVIDEVLISLFREPHSFTKENSVEISCHGSPLIVRQIIQSFLKRGVRLAGPGEFTRRAFLNGRFDLAQAEAVADLINAETENARQAAINQMRGGFSAEIRQLREELIHFASLIELELDFAEEDVEFAGRKDLTDLVNKIIAYINPLIDSFDKGNVIKNGVPTVIAGKPNAGKSTLLNALLNEDRAIVSDIPGTTRDVIEDEINLGGIRFRFMDTAGLRETSDTLEAIGIHRTRESMKKASLILYLFDLSNSTPAEMVVEEKELAALGVPCLKIGNKVDKALPAALEYADNHKFILISAATHHNLNELRTRIIHTVHVQQVKPGDVLVTNLRHYHMLMETRQSLERVLSGLATGVTGDFLAMDIRQSLHYLGEITGAITTDDLLANIFSKFCIGK
jgi:tRNA modification GTPase